MQSFFSTPQAIATLVAAVIAALASVFAAIYARRTQKSVAAQQSKLQGEVESLKDSLERNRSFSTLVRERIVTFTDEVLKSYSTLSSLSYIVILRSWLNAGDYSQIEMKVHSELSTMQTQLSILRKLNAISEQSFERSSNAISEIRDSWVEVTDQLTLLNPKFREKFSTSPEFSELEYLHKWSKFQTTILKSGEDILSTCATVSLPK